MELPSESDAREAVAEYGRRLVDADLTRHTGGNVSVRVGPERFAVSPSGVPYHAVDPADVPVVALDGERIDGDRRPSSETPMHAQVYRARPQAGGVIHTHSPFASAYATARRTLEPAYYLVALAGDRVPVAEYAPPGSEALGEVAVDALGDRNAVFLANHGVLAVGEGIESAYEVAAQVEHSAEITYRAEQLGDPEPLDDEIDDLVEYFR